MQEQADALSLSFEEPLKEAVRNVRSAKSVTADRSNALAMLQQVRPVSLQLADFWHTSAESVGLKHGVLGILKRHHKRLATIPISDPEPTICLAS